MHIGDGKLTVTDAHWSPVRVLGRLESFRKRGETFLWIFWG